MYDFGKKKNKKLLAGIIIVVVAAMLQRCLQRYYKCIPPFCFHVKYTKNPRVSQTYSCLCTLKRKARMGYNERKQSICLAKQALAEQRTDISEGRI